MADREGPRILITRLSAVGDCVLSMPVLCALRDHFPDATLSWLVEPLGSQLLAGHRDLDHLIVVPRGWLKSPRLAAQLRRRLRDYRFDVVVDVQSLTKSSVAGWLSGARTRIGFAPPQGREAAPWLATERVVKTRDHVVDGYLQLLGPLGIDNPTARFRLPSSAEAVQAMRPLLRDERLSGGFAVINPGAGWDSKLWPADRYARVAQHLGRQYQLPSVVVWAGAREKAWAEQIVAGAPGHALLAPPTSLTELVEVVRAARIFVGSDTGPMHLAAAVGTPCVALFGPTRPEVCGPYGTGHARLQARQQTGTSRQRRGQDNAAMRAITVEDVFRGCRQVLASELASQYTGPPCTRPPSAAGAGNPDSRRRETSQQPLEAFDSRAA